MPEHISRGNDDRAISLGTGSGAFVVSYSFRRSSRARRLSLKIERTRRVLVILPAWCTEEDGLRFMRQKSDWLHKYLARPAVEETLHGFLLRQKYLSIEGKQVPIAFIEGRERLSLRYSLRTSEVVIGLGQEENRELALAQVLHGLARRVLVYRTLALSKSKSLEISRVTVRDQSSRWGSCSSKGTISLNWRLLLLPPEIHDYVIWHELAHLEEMNHSSKFWKVLCSMDPTAREHDRRLTALGRNIMALGVCRASPTDS